MSADWFQDVHEFHRQVTPDSIGTTPAAPQFGTIDRRVRLMDEELRETREAMEAGDLPGVADGLADLIYVAIGTAVSYGIDLRPVWDEVHRANMAKKGGPVRPDGKALKPPGWKPPDVAGILARQGSIRQSP